MAEVGITHCVAVGEKITIIISGINRQGRFLGYYRGLIIFVCEDILARCGMTVTGIVDVLGRNCAFLRVTDKDLIATVGMFENHIATKEQIKEIWKGMGPK